MPHAPAEMNTGHSLQSLAGLKQKKPGPRPNLCKWCSDLNCSHCQCLGFEKCDHELGKMCKREKYKRRLVCNPCEKNKLKFKKDSPVVSQLPSKHMKRSISMDSGLNSMLVDVGKLWKDSLAPISEVEPATARVEEAKVKFLRVRSSVQLSSICPDDDETLDATAALLMMGSSPPSSLMPVMVHSNIRRTESSDGVVFLGLKDSSASRPMFHSSSSSLKSLQYPVVMRTDRPSNEGSIMFMREDGLDRRQDSHSLGDIADLLRRDHF